MLNYNTGKYYTLREGIEYVRDIPYIENYLALYLCIKPIRSKNKDEKCVSQKRSYLTSAEALRLMGLDVKETKKVAKNSVNYNGK